MIKLKWPSQLYADQVIGLDTPTDELELKTDNKLVTMGIDQLALHGDYPIKLHEVTSKYISNADCIAPKTKYTSPEITNSMLCKKSYEGRNACRVIISIFFALQPCHYLFFPRLKFVCIVTVSIPSDKNNG
jgi:hypothetical protein